MTYYEKLAQENGIWMEVIGGLQAGRLGRIYALLKERRLVFGLRTGGVGVFNLANLVHFSVHPEPPEANSAAAAIPREFAGQRLNVTDSRHRQKAEPIRVRYG